MILPYTMVGRKGLVATYKIVELAETQLVKGNFVECGIARGGSVALMLLSSSIARRTLYRRDTWLFDSFEGLPEPTAEDGVLRKPQGKDRSSWDLAKGYCLGTQEEVEDLLFNKFGFSRDKVHLVKGWFQDTLPQYRERVGDIAVLRIDGDWYESTKCCLENLYDNVVDGGYVILDDYALVGCRRAVDEFFVGKEYPEMILDGRGGGWFKKKWYQRADTQGRVIPEQDTKPCIRQGAPFRRGYDNYPDSYSDWRRFVVQASREVLDKGSVDAIMSTCPVTSHLVASSLKTEYPDVKWICDLPDLWSQNHNYGYGEWRRKLDRRLELKTLASADVLTTSSEPRAEQLRELHKGKRVVAITLGYDEREYADMDMELLND